MNPAKWWASSSDNAATIAAQFLSEKIYAPVTSGKLYALATDPIDLTRYSSIHIKAKRLDTDLSTWVTLQISPSAQFINYITRIAMNQNTMTEYVLDITNITTSCYIIVLTTNFNLGFEIEAIWLE